jgi:putative chitinase
MLTIDIMHQMWPSGDAKKPGLIAGIANAAPVVFPKYGLTSDLPIAHAMAQFSHECGAGNELEENLNYSEQGLINTWPTRFNPGNTGAFARQPQKIANQVYDGRMGNLPASNDGWNFRGRGGSQVTGRDGYDKLGLRIGQNLINNPDLVNDPQHFLECAVADFVICGCLPFALHDDVSGVTYHLNGGYIGLSERTAWLARWKAVLSINLPGTADHGTPWLQQSLNKLGAEPPLTVDGSFGPLTMAAVKAFQQSHGLVQDGKLTTETEAAIEKALAAA